MNNDEPTPTYYSKDDTIEQMRTNLDMLAGIALPEECTEAFADIHHHIWKMLTDAVVSVESVLKYAIGLPRGHAKTFLLKLLCLYIILFTDRRFILVICSTATKAETFIDDVVDLLDRDNIINLFGDWRSDITNDNQKQKKFKFRGRTIILKPQGTSGSVRGASIAWSRPDVIICDDIQDLEDSKSLELSMKLLQWFLGTLLKARSPRRCTIIYLGNMYPDVEMGERGSGLYTCLLRNLQRSSEWVSWVTGAIRSDGTALWEAVHPIKNLLSDLKQDTDMGQQDLFFAEVQNDPSASSNKYLDASKIPEYPYNDQFDMVIGKYLVIDPSLGKKKSDDQIVGLFYVYDHKGPVLRKIKNIQKSAPELVKEVLTWCLVERIPLVVAESVSYQATLIQWFVFWIDRLSIEGIAVQGVTPKGMSKVSRILAYFKSLMAGTSMLHADTLSLILSQAQLYQPTKSNNIDDMLDVGAYGEDVFVSCSDKYLMPIEGITSTSDVAVNNDYVEEYDALDYNSNIDFY